MWDSEETIWDPTLSLGRVMPPSDFALDSFRSSFSQTKKNWPERLLPRPSTPQTLTHMWNSFPPNFPFNLPNYFETYKNRCFSTYPDFVSLPLIVERNKKNLWQLFLDNFQRKRTKKKSKQIGQEKVALMITGAGVVARKLTFSNKVSELLDGAPPAPRWLFHYITVTSHAASAGLVAYSDHEYYPGQKNGH